jgi:hypothetical protein
MNVQAAAQLGRRQKEASHPEGALTPCEGIYDRLDVWRGWGGFG